MQGLIRVQLKARDFKIVQNYGLKGPGRAVLSSVGTYPWHVCRLPLCVYTDSESPEPW